MIWRDILLRGILLSGILLRWIIRPGVFMCPNSKYKLWKRETEKTFSVNCLNLLPSSLNACLPTPENDLGKILLPLSFFLLLKEVDNQHQIQNSFKYCAYTIKTCRKIFWSPKGASPRDWLCYFVRILGSYASRLQICPHQLAWACVYAFHNYPIPVLLT